MSYLAEEDPASECYWCRSLRRDGHGMCDAYSTWFIGEAEPTFGYGAASWSEDGPFTPWNGGPIVPRIRMDLRRYSDEELVWHVICGYMMEVARPCTNEF